MMHENRSPLAGQTVRINFRGDAPGLSQGQHEFHVEDYWDRVAGMSWMYSDGNFAAMGYGMRSGIAGLPLDDEVLYGKVGGLGYIVHVSEVVDNG